MLKVKSTWQIQEHAAFVTGQTFDVWWEWVREKITYRDGLKKSTCADERQAFPLWLSYTLPLCRDNWRPGIVRARPYDVAMRDDVEGETGEGEGVDDGPSPP